MAQGQQVIHIWCTVSRQQSRASDELQLYHKHCIPWSPCPRAQHRREVISAMHALPSPNAFSGTAWRSQEGKRRSEDGLLIPWACPMAPRGQFVPQPSGQKARVPTADLGATSLHSTFLCAPLGSCLPGHSQALQASSDFPANPSPADLP